MSQELAHMLFYRGGHGDIEKEVRRLERRVGTAFKVFTMKWERGRGK